MYIQILQLFQTVIEQLNILYASKHPQHHPPRWLSCSNWLSKCSNALVTSCPCILWSMQIHVIICIHFSGRVWTYSSKGQRYILLSFMYKFCIYTRIYQLLFAKMQISSSSSRQYKYTNVERRAHLITIEIWRDSGDISLQCINAMHLLLSNSSFIARKWSTI